MLLALQSAMGLNIAYFFAYTYMAARRRSPGSTFRRLTLPLELYFCLLNPLAYLLILRRTSSDAVFLDVSPSSLDFLAWLVLGVVWSVRLIGWGSRRQVRILLYLTVMLLVLYLCKDLQHWALDQTIGKGRSENSWQNLLDFGVLALYLTPIVIVLGYLRNMPKEGDWLGESGMQILPRRSGRIVWTSVVVVIGLHTVLLAWNPSETATRQFLADHRSTILAAAEQTGTDPRLLAAVIYEIQVRQVSVLGSWLEVMLMNVWLEDPKSHFGLSDSLDVSIGVAQIKPVTAQTALRILEISRSPSGEATHSKQYRDVPFLGASWNLGSERVEIVDIDVTLRDLPEKAEIVELLVDEEGNIRMCALILALYAAHWEKADPSWSIQKRPEILATLYQLGFERSSPKPDPRANLFGEGVCRTMDGEWMQTFLPGSTCRSMGSRSSPEIGGR